MKLIQSSLSSLSLQNRWSYISGGNRRQLLSTTIIHQQQRPVVLFVMNKNDYEVIKMVSSHNNNNNNNTTTTNSNTKYNHTFKRSMVMITKTKADENIVVVSSSSSPAPLKSSATTDTTITTTTPSSGVTTTTTNSYKVEGPTATTTNDNEEQKKTNYSLIITDSCWERIQQLAQRKKMNVDTLYLRVYVDAGGCSGFSYKFELETNDTYNDTEDIVFTHLQSGARLIVDRNSYEFLHHSTIDYTQEMIKSTFEVKNNPQSESACGCGSSFALKNFQSNPALD